MISAALIAVAVTSLLGEWNYSAVTGWDVAAAVFSGWTWLSIARMGPEQTASHATREDPGRTQSDLIVIIASVVSLAAVGFVLVRVGSTEGSTRDLLTALAVGSVALSWVTLHTLFTLRYALLYYSGSPGGVDFNQKSPPPRYVDFAYLAFTIGMTFQVSDTDLESHVIRATALRHALLSFLFGAVILATTINLVAGLASK